jgi:hypothetical protein
MKIIQWQLPSPWEEHVYKKGRMNLLLLPSSFVEHVGYSSLAPWPSFRHGAPTTMHPHFMLVV